MGGSTQGVSGEAGQASLGGLDGLCLRIEGGVTCSLERPRSPTLLLLTLGSLCLCCGSAAAVGWRLWYATVLCALCSIEGICGSVAVQTAVCRTLQSCKTRVSQTEARDTAPGCCAARTSNRESVNCEHLYSGPAVSGAVSICSLLWLLPTQHTRPLAVLPPDDTAQQQSEGARGEVLLQRASIHFKTLGYLF